MAVQARSCQSAPVNDSPARGTRLPSRRENGKLPPETPDLVMAKTPGAAQRKWRVPTEFPCCPQKPEDQPVAAYAANLVAGAVFSQNDLSTHKVLESALIDDDQAVCVMCESDGLKPWSLAKITFEDGLYVHTSISTFFSKEGAEKQFCLARGLEWTGGDSIDDYC
jgi:hypothetical protein